MERSCAVCLKLLRNTGLANCAVLVEGSLTKKVEKLPLVWISTVGPEQLEINATKILEVELEARRDLICVVLNTIFVPFVQNAVDHSHLRRACLVLMRQIFSSILQRVISAQEVSSKEGLIRMELGYAVPLPLLSSHKISISFNKFIIKSIIYLK